MNAAYLLGLDGHVKPKYRTDGGRKEAKPLRAPGGQILTAAVL